MTRIAAILGLLARCLEDAIPIPKVSSRLLVYHRTRFVRHGNEPYNSEPTCCSIVKNNARKEPHPMSETCPFCRIIRRHLPAFVITEDDHVIVFLSKENHPLIVSKQHIPNIYALDDTTGAHLMRAAIQIARAVKAGLQCEGVYLTQANEPAAGQDVFHVHLHIYPRWQAVDFRAQQMSEQVTEQDKQTTLQKIQAGLVHAGAAHLTR